MDIDGRVVIDGERCTGCGACVRICHEGCMSLVEGRVSIDELFKQRRSIRSYKKGKIDRGLLAEMVNYGIYAPTHSYVLRAIVVDDEEIMEELDRILMRFVSLVYNVVYRPKIVGALAGMIGMAQEYGLNRPKIEHSLERGYAFEHPAAIVFIVGDRRIPLSEASAQYMLANITFYAQSKGIASCLWGNGPIFMDRSRTARRRGSGTRWRAGGCASSGTGRGASAVWKPRLLRRGRLC